MSVPDSLQVPFTLDGYPALGPDDTDVHLEKTSDLAHEVLRTRES